MSQSAVETKLGLRRDAAPGYKRLRLTIAYCGTRWHGWQSQECGGGIQDVISGAILKATGITTSIQGSGRTDAGVHALAQVAHCDVPESVRMSDAAWLSAINACLPLEIRIIELREVPGTFHARFDSVGKIYRYRIWRPRLLSPFEADRCWHIFGPLDMAAMRECSQMLIGTHNFVRLSANRGNMPETQRRLHPEMSTRTIQRVDIRETEELLELEFEGDGFLYKMVRLMVGSLVHVARGRATREWFANLLTSSEGLQSHQTAPACGLYLVQVHYPDSGVDG